MSAGRSLHSQQRKLVCAKMGAIPYMAILAELTSDEVLETAYGWLCKRRRNYPADADVWSFRQRWPADKDRLKAELAAGRFRFGLLTRITLVDGEEVDLWSARDALVLKALTIVLAKHLPVSDRCTHVKGHGGAKAAVRQVWARLAENRFVLRTDVKSYYASIDHFLLLDQLADVSTPIGAAAGKRCHPIRWVNKKSKM